MAGSGPAMTGGAGVWSPPWPRRRSIMDFDDTPEEAAFRAEARAFLAANARPKDRRGRGRPLRRYRPGGDSPPPRPGSARRPRRRFACITWPEQWGGRGGTQMQQIIFNQEEQNYEVPPNVFLIGLGMCVPTMIAYAKDGAVAALRPAGGARRGDLVPAVLRTGRRVRRRRPAHPGGEARRRVGGERAEDLDLRRALRASTACC